MSFYEKCAELIAARKNAAAVTVVRVSKGAPCRVGFKLVYSEDEELYGTVGGGALEYQAIGEAKRTLKDKQSRLISMNLKELGMQCGGMVEIFVEYLQAQEQFLIFGGGHIGKALTPILESLGFRVIVFDNRKEVGEEFCRPLSQKTTREVIIGEYGDISSVIGSSGYCFIATHAHEYDYIVLKQLLTHSLEYEYMGVIGSKKKITAMAHRLAEEGIAIPDFLYAPVGLDLGGESPVEIAVSVAAEIVVLKHRAARNRTVKNRATKDSSKLDSAVEHMRLDFTL